MYSSLFNPPIQHGYYRCKMEPCNFCPNGITADEDYIGPDDTTFGRTCGVLFNHAKTLKSENAVLCQDLKNAEQICCPSSANDEL